MKTMAETFENLLVEKSVPIDKVELDENLTLFQLHQIIKQNHFSRLEIIVPKQVVGDIQITYRFIGQLNNYAKKAEMLEEVNHLNEQLTGYYTLFLAGDGELYLKLLSRSNESSMEQVYEMLITGLHTAKEILPNIEKITGAFQNVEN